MSLTSPCSYRRIRFKFEHKLVVTPEKLNSASRRYCKKHVATTLTSASYGRKTRIGRLFFIRLFITAIRIVIS